MNWTFRRLVAHRQWHRMPTCFDGKPIDGGLYASRSEDEQRDS